MLTLPKNQRVPMKYSIITINYNNRDGLARTIESVVGQTCRDYEYLIIDGGSTDGSVDVIKAHEACIDYRVSEQDHGVYHAMNKGVAQAHGDYCIFMNSGDCFHAIDALEAATGYDEDIICGKVLKGSNPRPQGHHKNDITLVDLMRGSLPHQAMIIKRELLVRHPYDEHYKILSDWKFCLQTLVFDNCCFRNIDTIIADYDTTGISSNSNGLLPKERDQILKELFPPRVLADYQRLTPVDDELLDLSVRLTQTVGIRHLTKKIIYLLLRLSHKKH